MENRKSKNGYAQKYAIEKQSGESIESVLKKKKESYGWKNLHKRKVLSLERSEGMIDDESGKSMEPMFEIVPLFIVGPLFLILSVSLFNFTVFLNDFLGAC